MAYKQFYLIPMEVDILADGTRANCGKYLSRQHKEGGFHNWSLQPYGEEPYALCCFTAESVDHDSLATNSDVFQFPVNLEDTVSVEQTGILKSEMRKRGLCSDWVESNKTHKGVIMNILRTCWIMQGIGNDGVTKIVDTKNMSTSVNASSAKEKERLTYMADRQGISLKEGASLEETMTDLMDSVPRNKRFDFAGIKF